MRRQCEGIQRGRPGLVHQEQRRVLRRGQRLPVVGKKWHQTGQWSSCLNDSISRETLEAACLLSLKDTVVKNKKVS